MVLARKKIVTALFGKFEMIRQTKCDIKAVSFELETELKHQQDRLYDKAK